jgi:cytosine/adenosine deaminase-related metal-dependent hydrolase
MADESISSLLIKNTAIVSVDPHVGTIPNGDIHVRGDEIVQIGENLEAPGAEIIDGARTITVPGFVDGHRHMWEGLLRNALPDGDINDYLQAVNGAFAKAYSPDDAYIGELITALGALSAGVTTVLDWSHIQTTPDHTSAVIEALRRSSIRAVFGYGPPGAYDRGHRWPHDLKTLRETEFSRASDLLSLALATYSPEHQPYDTAKEHFALARDAGALISVHAGLNGIGEPGQIERFARDGLLGPDVNLVHCNTFSDTEWKLVADSGASVSITPSTEMQMGQGIPPLRQALEVGVLPSIGVDVEVSVATDMWTQMRILFGVHRSQVFQDRFAGRPAPEPLTSATILECATMGGAYACGLADRIGSLSVGKQADMVLLRTDTFHSLPVNDLTSVVVHNMDARNVDTVIVGGRQVKRDGQLVGVDVESLAGRLYEARDRVFATAGVPLPAAAHR